VVDPRVLRSDLSPDVAPLVWKNGKRCAPEGCYIDDRGNIIRDAKPMLIRETRGFWVRNWPVWVGLVVGIVLGYVVGVVLKGAWAACG